MTTFLLDCDPGHDDAVALLFAAGHLNLIAVTTVFGNTGISNTSRNALAIIESAGLDVPVSAGADRPLLGEVKSAEAVHGKSGLDGANFPPPSRAVTTESAVETILRLSHEQDDLHIIATAPLTNIATALAADRSLASRIEGISIMGGSTLGGNATPAAEFNFLADPEAARLVFNAGAPITMVGLNVTATFGIDDQGVTQLRNGESRTAAEIGGALGFYLDRQHSLYGRRYAALHDVCAVVPFTHPDLIQYETMHVDIETEGTLTRGMSVCDQRGMSAAEGLVAPQPPNVQVAVAADGDRIVQAVLDTLLKFP